MDKIMNILESLGIFIERVEFCEKGFLDSKILSIENVKKFENFWFSGQILKYSLLISEIHRLLFSFNILFSTSEVMIYFMNCFGAVLVLGKFCFTKVATCVDKLLANTRYGLHWICGRISSWTECDQERKIYKGQSWVVSFPAAVVDIWCDPCKASNWIRGILTRLRTQLRCSLFGEGVFQTIILLFDGCVNYVLKISSYNSVYFHFLKHFYIVMFEYFGWCLVEKKIFKRSLLIFLWSHVILDRSLDSFIWDLSKCRKKSETVRDLRPQNWYSYVS